VSSVRYRRSSKVLLAVILSALAVVSSAIPVLASYHYHDVVAADGPTIYFPFDEGSGNAIDAVSARTCSAPSPAWDTTGMVTGSSHRMKGTGFGGCLVSGLTVMGQGTSFEAWFAGTSCGTDGILSSISSRSGNQRNTNFRCDAGNFVYDDFDAASGGYGLTCSASGTLDGLPHYIAVSISPTNVVTIYKDATSCSSGTSTTGAWGTPCDPSATANCTRIGSRYDGSNGLPTSDFVGQVAWYPFTMTSGQVAAHYAARTSLPPNALFITPQFNSAITGQGVTYTYAVTDSSGHPTADTITYTGSSPSGACVTGTAGFTGGYFTCTAGPVGIYGLTFHAAVANVDTTAQLFIFSAANAFVILPRSQSVPAGANATYHNYSGDNSGNDISRFDSWSFNTIPSGVTCQPPAQGSANISQTCTSDTVGTYTLIGTNSGPGGGVQSTVTLIVTSGPVASGTSCHSGNLVADTVCYLAGLFSAITSLPGDLANAIYGVLFVSSSGRSFLDLSALTNAAWPTVTCRSGQTPTASGGLCYAFPFSIPSDLGVIVNLVNATATAPTLSIVWDFPLWTGTTLHETGTVDPRVVLTDTTMMYVRDIELFMFIVGCAFGTWRIMEMIGVG